MIGGRFIGKTLALTMIGLTLGACDDNGPDSDEVTVRFANGQVGNPIALYADGEAQGSAVTYQQQSSSCHTIDDGSTEFSFRETGSPTARLTLNSETLVGGRRYTVIATGVSTVPRGIILADNISTPAAGRAKLRVVNGTNQATSFDVYVGTPGSPLGTVNKSNLGFNVAETLDVPAGQTQVRLTGVGNLTVISTSANITLNSGDIRTLVITPPPTVGANLTSFLVTPCP